MNSIDERTLRERRLDDMSEADAFKEMYSRIAGYWPEDREEREQLFWSSPGLMTSVLAGAYRLGGMLTEKEAKELENLFAGLLRIVLQAHAGDESVKQQLLAVKKLISPATYEVPLKVIEDLAKKYNTVGPLARGWEIRRLMVQLSTMVVPANSQNRDLLKGPVKLSEETSVKQSALYEEAAGKCHRRTTLQSLAISVYLSRLEQQGDFITDVRSLKRDLEKVRRWEMRDRRHIAAKILSLSSGQRLIPFLIPTVRLSERELPIP